MFKYLFIIFVLIILLSCESDLNDEKEELNYISARHTFLKIEFVFNEYTQINDIVENAPITMIFNNTDNEQYYIYDPTIRFFNTSFFWSSDSRAFLETYNEQYVKTPIDKDMDKNFLYDNGDFWVYSEIEQRKRPKTERKDTLKLEPLQQLIIIPRFYIRKINTPYRLYFKNVEKEKKLIINGQWSGTFFIKYDADYYVN